VAQLKESIDAADIVLSPDVVAGINAIHANYINAGQ